MLICASRHICQSRRRHGALAFIQMPATQIEADDIPDRIGSGIGFKTRFDASGIAGPIPHGIPAEVGLSSTVDVGFNRRKGAKLALALPILVCKSSPAIRVIPIDHMRIDSTWRSKIKKKNDRGGVRLET